MKFEYFYSDRREAMYTNVAYIGETHEAVVDTNVLLSVTAIGNYRIQSIPVLQTKRLKGREDYQLLYIAAGKVHFFFDLKERVVGKGNMVLFRPGEPQLYNLYAEDKPETYCVHFTGSEVEQLLDYYQVPEDENVFYTGTSSDYQWLYRKMIQELQFRRENYNEVLNINLRHILLMLNRHMKEKNQNRTDILDEVERATNYFNENYNTKISIEKYAEDHNITPCWFIQNFKLVTRMTPLQYLVTLRINNAMNLLNNTNYNITQIASAVGYDNSLYFSRLLKNHVGMSPKEYRKKKKRQ